MFASGLYPNISKKYFKTKLKIIGQMIIINFIFSNVSSHDNSQSAIQKDCI